MKFTQEMTVIKFIVWLPFDISKMIRVKSLFRYNYQIICITKI